MKRSTKRRGAESETPKHRASKDTKHWCLGREGRKHLCAWQPAYSPRGRPSPDYPNLLLLRCTHPPCNKVILESWRLERAWPTQWGSRHDPSTVPAFYGPGLPRDFGWGEDEVPYYVDVVGIPR